MTGSSPLVLLAAQPVERPWGGSGVPALGLAGVPGKPTGEYWLPTTEFPLLVKILDSRENLSVQLHPDDETARALGLANGKTEAWVVLAASPGASLWLGLAPGEDPASLLAAAARGEDVSTRLIRHQPSPGEFFFVPAGTVHALGAGLTVLEIQQPSDVTYRIWDWNRQPARPLHLKEARVALKTRTDAYSRPWAAGVEAPFVSGPHFEIAVLAIDQAGKEVPIEGDSAMYFVRAGRGIVRGGEIALDLRPGAFFLARSPLRSIVIAATRSADAAASLELVRISPR